MPNPKILEETETMVKFRIELTGNAFIYIRFNDVLQELRTALIVDNVRVFGVNGEFGNWHVHPLHDTDKHERIDEKTLDEILEEYVKVIRDKRLSAKR
jgi:hypothetical protein